MIFRLSSKLVIVKKAFLRNKSGQIIIENFHKNLIFFLFQKMYDEPLEQLEFSYLPSNNENVDIITRCSLPSRLVPPQPKARRKTVVKDNPVFRVRENSLDDISIFNKLDSLFKNDNTTGNCKRAKQENNNDNKIKNNTINMHLEAQNNSMKNDDFTIFDNFDDLLFENFPIDKDEFDGIVASLNAQMIKEKSDLDEYLIDASQHSLNIAQISDILVEHKLYDTPLIRNKYIKKVVLEELAIKKCRRFMNIARYNIQIIDSFQNFLKEKAKTAKNLPGIDIDSFLNIYIKQYTNSNKLDIKYYHIQEQIRAQDEFDQELRINEEKKNSLSLKKKLNSKKQNQKNLNNDQTVQNFQDINFIASYLSPKNKSGRIIAKFLDSINDMTYSDLDVITIAVSNKSTYSTVRNLMFDLSWQYKEYAFGHVSNLKFPNIFDLTPSIFNPPYLEKEFFKMQFSVLNNSQWPYKFTEPYFFTLMCYRNPFAIASRFWEIIQSVANVLQSQAIKVGKIPKEDVELGFDDLFPTLLTCIYAFGCSELLNTLEYCSQFVDFTSNIQQKFAMTHCAGIIDVVRNSSEEELRRRAKKQG